MRNNPAVVLGGLTPQRVIAAGESQSASRLVTYIDAIQPLAHMFDGFMVHSRSAGGARLTQAPLPDVPVPSPLKIRDDLDVPVMVLQAETDVIGSNLGARQPDTAKFREWEMAGTSHADSYTISVGGSDIGDGSGATQMFAFMRNPAGGRVREPRQRRSRTTGSSRPRTTTSRRGYATARHRPSGRRCRSRRRRRWCSPATRRATPSAASASPQVDAPVATLTGSNSGAGFCVLFGTTTPLTTGAA